MTKLKKTLKVRIYHRLGNTTLGTPALTMDPQSDMVIFLKHLPAISEHTVMKPLFQNYEYLKIMSKNSLSTWEGSLGFESDDSTSRKNCDKKKNTGRLHQINSLSCFRNHPRYFLSSSRYLLRADIRIETYGLWHQNFHENRDCLYI